MDTEQRSSVEPVDQVYDGFISYSHAADDLLAPRLQSALQRFAKPWWKRRAMRIFRDESSLSANPHLWSSITEALDASGWFVLLLSPDAAHSEWVSQEIAYWVENRDPRKILPVVTDGTFGWAEGDVAGDAVPDVLSGVFSEEPRWVDVRWAKDEDQLDLKDPRYADAIADIASTIRGVPKDDLASEEVRQHRRTVRTAWAGVSLIGVLAVASLGFGVNAANERDRADIEADRANTLAEQEAAARDEADANAARAATNADEAEAQAALARGRELAASSVNVRESDPELATLLAIEAIHAAGGGENALFEEGLISLREATYANRLVARRLDTNPGGRVDVAFMPDGSGVLVASESDRSVSLLDIDDLAGEPVWTYQDLTTNDIFRRAVPHPDGSEVAVIVVDGPFAGDPGPAVDVGAGGEDASPGRIIVLDASMGTVDEVVALEGCIEPLIEDFWGTNRSGYSPQGSVFHLLVQDTECAGEPPVPLDVGQSGFWDTVLLDTANWTETRRLSDWDGYQFGQISFDAAETQALIHFEVDRTELRTYPDLELLETIEWRAGPMTITRMSPGGDRYFAEVFYERPAFFDSQDGSLLGWVADGSIWLDTVFTADGLALVYGSGATHLYDPATALFLLSLPTKGVQSADVSPAGTLAATASLAGDIELWRLEDAGALVPPSGTAIDWVNPNEIIEGSSPAFRAFASPTHAVFVFDPTTGTIEAEFSTWAADALPDGRYVLSMSEIRVDADGNDALWEGPLIVRDVAGGSIDVLQDCTKYVGAGIIVRRGVPKCPDGSPLFTPTVRVSRDGSRIAAMAVGGEIRIWDAETLEVITTIDSAAGDGLLGYGDGWLMTGLRTDSLDKGDVTLYVIDAETGDLVSELIGNWKLGVSALSSDGERLFVMESGGRAFEYDTKTWELTREWLAQASNARGIAISDDDSRLAVSGEDGIIAIWSVDREEPELVQRVPAAADLVSDIMWLDDERVGALLLHGAGASWQVIDLSTDAVIDKALADLIRGFTDTECETYRIDSCPTLDEMRSR